MDQDDGRPLRVFVSGVASATHLLYVSSYVSHLLDRTAGPVEVVDLGLRRFLGRANVSTSDVVRLMPSDARLTVSAPDGGHRWAAQAGERLVYVAVGAPGIKPFARLRASHPSRPVHLVVVDEGLGSYGDWHTRRDAWRREGGREPWPTLRSLAVAGARRGLTDERWALFRWLDDRWVVDERVAAPFRSSSSGAPAPTPAAGSGSADAVWLSQPFVELGLMSDRAYLEHLQAVSKSAEAFGLRLWVRPHPGEDAGRYVGVMPTAPEGATASTAPATPAEIDPAVTSARVVLGSTSSALLNVASLHGLSALRVSLPELIRLEVQLGPRQASLLDSFLPPPVTVPELSARLSQLLTA